MKTITNTIYPAFALFALACFALSPQARAVCQQGCDLSSGDTFLGDGALVNNTTGGLNTAIGSDALTNNISGIACTAVGANALKSTVYSAISDTGVGYEALQDNLTGVDNTAVGALALTFNTAAPTTPRLEPERSITTLVHRTLPLAMIL